MATDSAIIEALKQARLQQGLSQRALSQRVGLPQSHISKIESGAVDLQLSSLVELARVLDLDLRLVPRKAIPAVDSVVRGTLPTLDSDAQARLQDGFSRLAEALRPLNDKSLAPELARLRDSVHLLQHVTIPAADLTAAQKALDNLKPLLQAQGGTVQDLAALQTPQLKKASETLRHIRNHLAHADAPAAPRPAYTLDNEDDDA